MTRAETMARWFGANVACCDPFDIRPDFDMGSDECRAHNIKRAGEVITALEAMPAPERAGALASDAGLRSVLLCGCEGFPVAWDEMHAEGQQHLRVMAARWLGALDGCTKLTRNAARCVDCGTVLESTHAHDFRRCPCGNFVDGGLEYVRRGYSRDGVLVDLCEYTEAK